LKYNDIYIKEILKEKMKKNILTENMRRFGTKNLHEEPMGSTPPLLDRMQVIYDLIGHFEYGGIQVKIIERGKETLVPVIKEKGFEKDGTVVVFIDKPWLFDRNTKLKIKFKEHYKKYKNSSGYKLVGIGTGFSTPKKERLTGDGVLFSSKYVNPGLEKPITISLNFTASKYRK
tara:strand:+ start:334 stop:855 length:522 start_codon:yes stop_codon:yes gene_type:complete